MRVLVTGVSGFSGSFVARTLVRAGFDVVGTHRRETEFLSRLVHDVRLDLFHGDLGGIRALQGPFDAVVHTAATSPADGVSAARMARDNVDATLALLDIAEEWQCRAFVLFSSLSVYGEVAGPVLDETCPIVNPDAYGTTKRVGEILLSERTANLPGLALRLPGVIGPGAHRNWLSGVATKLLAGETVRAFHLDGEFNNAAHIRDIAGMVETAIKQRWQGFDAVVLGARGTTPVRSAIERLARGLGVPAKIEPIAALKPGFILSSQRAIDRWRYEPMAIDDMIDRYAEDIRSATPRS